jgi:hypothetical protein
VNWAQNSTVSGCWLRLGQRQTHLIGSHQLYEFGEQVALDEAGVDLGYSIAIIMAISSTPGQTTPARHLHLGTSNDRQMSHPHELRAALFDDGQLTEMFDASRPSLSDLVEMFLIDQVDNG